MHRLLVSGFLALSLAGLVLAQILLKPSGGTFQTLRTKSVKASTKIDRGLATTTLTLVFSNSAQNRVEADFVYTVRPGTLVTGFAYWYANEKVVARVVERERALEIYDTITRPGKDPALVELIGKRTFRARIFPIEPMADLRVELKMVQPLEHGQTFVLPLKMSRGEQLDKLDVRIEVAPDPTILRVQTSVPMAVKGGVYTLRAERYRPQADLRLTLARAPRALRAALYAARSGGSEGYFTLSLTPSRTWRVERLDIRGVRTSGVRVPTRLTASETALLTGRYSGSGPATLVLKPRGAPAIEVPLVFAPSVEANHPGMKLWAEAEIERLGESEGVRHQVVTLSTRHTIPSKFTSWLAIPEAERRDFEEEIKRSRATLVARLLANEIAAGRETGARARQLDARLSGVAKELKLDKRELLQEFLWGYAQQLAEELSREIEKGHENGAKAKGQLARLSQLTKWTDKTPRKYVSDYLYEAYRQHSELLAREIIWDRSQGGEAKKQRKEVERLAKWIDTESPVRELDTLLWRRLWELAALAGRRRLDGTPEGAEARNEMQRIAGNMSVKDAQKRPEQMIDTYLNEQLDALARAYAQEALAGRESEARDGELRRAALRVGKSRDEFVRTAMASPLATFLNMYEKDSSKVFDLPALGAERAARLERLASLPPGFMAPTLQFQLQSRQFGMAVRELVLATEVGEDQAERPRRIRALAEDLARVLPNTRLAVSLAGQRTLRAQQLAEEYAPLLARHGRDWKAARDLRAKYDRLKRGGLNGNPLEESLLNAIRRRNTGLQWRQDETMRDFEAIAVEEREIARLVDVAGPAGSKFLAQLGSEDEDPETQTRRRLLVLLRNSSSDLEAIRKVEKELMAARAWRGEPYNQARVQRIGVEVTLERLQRQTRTPEIERQLAELNKRRQELHARMGDPLVTSNAPADARLVVARMPNGEVKRLEWNALSRRWEARFDIPATAADGEYEIEIIAVLANGERRITAVKYHVDNTAPQGTVALLLRHGKLRIDLACSTDTARVEAVLPWGDLVSLERSVEGRFFRFVDLPTGVQLPIRIRVVLTDKAHNRGEATAAIER